MLRHGGEGRRTCWRAAACASTIHAPPLVALMPECSTSARDCQAHLMRHMLAAMASEALNPAGRRHGNAGLADILFIHATDRGSRRRSIRLLGRSATGRSGGCCADPPAPERDWTVAALAASVNMGSVFSDRFTALVGAPPLLYLTRWRMHLAARWLREDRTSLGEVATRLGYESEPSFSRAFKRHIGVPPGAVRRGRTAGPVRPAAAAS